MPKLLARVCFLIILLFTTTVSADLVITVTENTVSGGTNWSFSNGSGLVSGQGNNFLVGATAANLQPFRATDDEDTNGLTVLAGSNVFGIVRIFTRDYSNLSGTNGNIFDGLDFQGQNAGIGGLPISSLNGLVLHADVFDITSLNEGVYTLDSYYSGYQTELGTVTLSVGAEYGPDNTLAESVPTMSAWGMIMLIGLLGFIAFRRRIA